MAMYTGMYREATTNDVRAGDRARSLLTRYPPMPHRRSIRITSATRRRASVARLRARWTSASSTPSRISARPPTNTQSTFDVSMPQTTAPIGSLIGKMFGRSARSTRTSACMPTSREPVTPRSPAAHGAVARCEADDVARGHQLRDAALARQLAVEHRGVLHRDRRPHLREEVAGRDAHVVDREARPHVVVEQVLDRRRSGAARHLAHRRDRDRRARGRDRVDVRRGAAGSRARP